MMEAIMDGRKQGEGLWHFLLVRYLSVFALVFLLIIGSLSIFLRIYIISGTAKQIEQTVEKDRGLSQMGKEYRPTRDIWEQRLKEAQEGTQGDERGLSGPLGSRTNSFVCLDGKVLEILHGDEEQVLEINGQLLERGAYAGEGVRNQRIEGEQGIYTATVIPDYIREDAYLIYYLDITQVMLFWRATMIALLVICVLGIFLGVLLSHWMATLLTQKVKALSAYAARVGEGEFDSTAPEFSIAEFDALSGEMESMAWKLKEAAQHQRSFFQNVSHELRTPLMSIRCYAEGIDYGVMEPKSSSETILSETDKLSALVEDILYLSRSEYQLELKKEWLDLRELFSGCVTRLRQVAEKEGISFVFRFSEEEVPCLCQEEDIVRLCSNLVSNALRYAKSQVIVACSMEGEEAYLCVNDDGEGISPEDLPHIFERFYKGTGGVHGIGLSIVQSVVERYGGRIRVENRGGACFEIWLPSGKVA